MRKQSPVRKLSLQMQSIRTEEIESGFQLNKKQSSSCLADLSYIMND